MSARLTLIAAVSADGFISRGSGVPWDLPADKTHFREQTTDKWLLLGRRTFDEMKGWFTPIQRPLVLTRDPNLRVPRGQTVASITQAIHLATDAGESEIFCLGGSEIYAAAMPHAHRLIITHVHEILGSGLPFPVISPREWEPVMRRSHPADEEHAQSFEIVTYHHVVRRGYDLAA
ncbi:MAG: dihydrofolate reductase [Verrucomicrobiota bacterium]